MTARAVEADVAVVGGGPAGAVAAALLAGAGRRVVLYERTAGPHPKVCGEFLSGEAAGPLARLGLDPARLGAAPVERLRLAGRGGGASCRLPFPAWGLSREVLDEALLAAAAAHGADLRRGAAVRAVAPAGAVLRVETAGGAAGRAAGETLAAARVLLATGKHDLRGHGRPPGRINDLIGFKQHWRLAPPARAALDGHVEMHLFAGGYAGFQPVEDGRVNLCLVIGRRRFERLGRDWAAVLAHVGAASPLFAGRLAGGAPCRPRPLAVARIPYGFVQRGGRHPGLHRVGDQLAVIPSLTGDGMAIALDSAARAAADVLRGGPPADGGRYARQVALAHAAARVAASGAGGTLATALAALAPGPAQRLVGALARATRVPG